VSINYYPNRKKMSREIGLCIVLKRRDVLESFCSSCIFHIFENTEVRECFSCEVQQGMNIIGQDCAMSAMPATVPFPESEATGFPGRKDVMGDDGDLMTRLRSYSKALLVPALLLCALLFGSASATAAVTPTSAAFSGPVVAGSSDRVKRKVLSVLESRIGDRTVLERAADKLGIMEGRRLRILSSLCDRISADPGAVGADIAFSLMTVMIVLS